MVSTRAQRRKQEPTQAPMAMCSEEKRVTEVSIAMLLKEAEGLYGSLQTEWRKEEPNLSICGELLSKLKISLVKLDFLPTTGTHCAEKQLLLAYGVLQIGALWSILKEDIPSFKRYVDQLKNYYFDYQDKLPESAYMHQLLGLNLLFLLSQNHMSEFHTELERLSAAAITTNDYIRHPLSLEQHLMEGSYNKVFLAKGNVPADTVKYTTFFMDILLGTTRDAIAAGMEKAYEQIQFDEAMQVLFFDSPEKMSEYARNRGWTQRPDGYYSYTTQQQRTEKVTTASKEMAQQVMAYARELEMIV